MTRLQPHLEPGRPPALAPTHSGHGRVAGTGPRHTSLGQTRQVSVRKRRMIARWLRRTAGYTEPTHPLTRRRETLLPHRVAAVPVQLLEIAALLELPPHPPDAAYVPALRELLANGCDSPLYNTDVPASEPHATLLYVRASLAGVKDGFGHPPSEDRVADRLSSAVVDLEWGA